MCVKWLTCFSPFLTVHTQSAVFHWQRQTPIEKKKGVRRGDKVVHVHIHFKGCSVARISARVQVPTHECWLNVEILTWDQSEADYIYECKNNNNIHYINNNGQTRGDKSNHSHYFWSLKSSSLATTPSSNNLWI